MQAGAPHLTAERVARRSYGKLLSILTARCGDITAAEDALAGAFEKALATWPERGVPDRPEAWLLTVARRDLTDQARHLQVHERHAPALQYMAEFLGMDETGAEDYPDERLKLLFVCTHPAIDQSLHTPLMLQTVLGFDASAIARAFLIKPAAMGQRLVRAKQKIRKAGISFSVPSKDQLAARLDGVLDAIYVAYTTGQNTSDSAGESWRSEAFWLGRLVVDLLPEAAEAKGLLALMLYQEARMTARYELTGEYVPLDRQDTALWNNGYIKQAETLLSVAASTGTLGRFQLEAAIQSAHTQGRFTGADNSSAIISLYTRLLSLAPSIGAHVARAAALARAGFANEALVSLDEVAPRSKNYQPFWATRAYALRLTSKADAAHEAYDRAIALSNDAAVRRFLIREKNALHTDEA